MIIQQPYTYSLGHAIISNLQNADYKLFQFIVAYSKTSGVNRLVPYMKVFKNNGGKIHGIVGIDQFNTSYEALKSLYSICDRLLVFHSENLSQTFHPKMYSFESTDDFWFSIGSNNMTAGGLFSNYETCFSSICKISDPNYKIFNKTFSDYSNTSSPCCSEVTDDFLNLLLQNNYIKTEKTIAKERFNTSTSKLTNSSQTLFGNEVFKAPPISSQESFIHTEETKLHVIPELQTSSTNLDYLIRFVPKAGDRSKQVHFNLDILNNYFKLKPGDSLEIQELSDIYSPKSIEQRVVVFSSHNKNVKIEINGAQILDTQYPEDTNKRPILIFKRIAPTLFEYMLLLDGSNGYDSLNNYLSPLPKLKTLAYKILSSEELLNIWDECPLV